MEIKRCYDTIIGASVGENQLVQNGDFADTSVWATVGVSLTVSGNVGTLTASGQDVYFSQPINIAHGHKFFMSADIKSSVAVTSNFSEGSTVKKSNSLTTTWGTFCGVFAKEASSVNINFVRIENASFSGTIDVRRCYLTDLTTELGSSIADYIYSLESATAGSGIAKLRSWGFLKGYQAFNAGSIKSVEVTGKKCVGFNCWDEVWRLGGYASDTGEYSANNSTICTKNPVPILPDTAYYPRSNVSANFRARFYDADMNYIGYTQKNGGSCSWNSAFTTPSNAYYLNFEVQAEYGTTYNHDICINLSNPDRNGEYEAYTEQSYDYGTDVLNGIFKLDANNNLYADGDTKTSDGTITRKCAKITLNGSESYSISTGTERNRMAWDSYEGTGKQNGTFASDKLTTVANAPGGYGSADWQIYGSTADPRMWITVPSSIATVDAFKAYLAEHPITVVYELATPTTEQSTPFSSPQVCYPDGTEEYVTSNGVPVGHETRYEL